MTTLSCKASCKACVDLVLVTLWFVETTGEGLADSARWFRSRLMDDAAEQGRHEPDVGEATEEDTETGPE